MASTTILAGLARLLNTAGAGTYAEDTALPITGTVIAIAEPPPTPDRAITVTTYPGGPEPDSRNGWEYPRLQVRVRAADPLDALQLDRDCFDALQAASGDLTGTPWHLQDCYALQSEAQPLGPDANGRHEFTRNYQLSIEPG